MISLFKIRYNYLKRHPCSLVFGYSFIPIILTLIFSFAAVIKALIVREQRKNKNKNDYDNYGYYSAISMKDNKRYEYNLSNSIIIVNDLKNGEKLSQFIQKVTNIKLDYFLDNKITKKSELNNYKYVINYQEIRGSNNFEIKTNPSISIFNITKIFNSLKFSELKKNVFYYIYNSHKNKDNTDGIKINNIKSLIVNYMAEEKRVKNFSNITVNSDIKRFESEYPEDKANNETADIYIGLIISFEMTLLSFYLTERMIEEKENKLNDFLERQGVSKRKYVMSWYVTYCILSILPFISFMCFGGFFFIFNYEFFLINLVLYFTSIYSCIYFFYTIINTLKKGSIIIKIFNFASTIIGIALTVPKTGRSIKLLFSFIPNINIYYTISIMYAISDYDEFKWSLLTWRIKHFCYWESFLIFIGQILIFSVISLFIQAFKRSGLSFLLFLKSFCCRISGNSNYELSQPLFINENQEQNLLNFEIHHQDLSLLEKQKKNENKLLKISGVTKKFGHLKAVDNFNAELFSNEIFCLLGHNGAGKTTLVNIISGLMEPEKGDVFLNGVSMITNKDLIYQNIGLCQQQNIFFEFLTVTEHLQFIYDIKGIQRNFIEIQELIIKLDLSDVQFRLCRDLSGGQKRKLCIALALLSGGKIIILDEPTSGMDVIAKKKLWEFLKNYQKEKIILITTHSLEEAEYLGTRIGIMTDGHFICSGTSTYLKSMYPCGININLVINSKTFSDESKRIIFEKVKEYEPLVEIKVASKGVFSLNIQQNNQHISEILDYIESIKFQYGIEDYIISSASLEDVFLKLGNKSSLKDMIYLSKSVENNNILENHVQPAGFCSQLCSQLYRNLLPIARNKILFILEYLGGLSCSYVFTFFFKGLFYDKSYKGNASSINLMYIALSIILGFIIYLGGIVYEKIKERKNKIKYLLYLSGCNMWSYWAAFFIIDYIKLIIFWFLILLPFYFYSPEISLGFFGCIPMLCLSSIIFIYYFSSFWRDEDSGTKILLISIAITLVFLGFFYGYVVVPLSLNYNFIREYFFNFLYKTYYFSILDITPISSLALSFYRIIESENYYEDYDYNDDKLKHIKDYVLSSVLTQFINFIFYFSLMILYETRILSKCCNGMHSPNSSYVFSEENAADEFYAYNNLRNPVLMVQNNNQNNGNNIMNNNANFFMNNNNINNNIVQNNNINQNNNNNQGNANIIGINSINDSINQNENNINIDANNNQNNQININNNNINNINNINNNNNIVNNQNNNLAQQINQINNVYRNYNLINNNYYMINRDNNRNPFVREEINKLNTQHNLTTRIEGLFKTFFYCCKKNVRVINNLNLGLEPNEKFGLLGFNGSGKTTTFRAITNEILYERGIITLFGYDNKTQFDSIRPIIGYCPQENPLFDFMKVKEIISFYLNLKRSRETIQSICSTFDLTQYLDTYCVNLSGGNKRKLTFAIALMNKPSLLLLDEPSSGVDPESRRIMWKNINALSSTGHKYNMILTTHSIEEAEILCDRVSWLKRGNFVCIGNPEQLKLKYSNGYKMHIKFVDSIINRKDVSTLTRQMVQDAYNEVNTLAKGFNIYSNYIFTNPIIILYIRAFIEVAREIKSNTSDLTLIEMEKDFSFLIQVGILKERQKLLFSQIFNLKSKNPKISEISINLESLGNILTLFG